MAFAQVKMEISKREKGKNGSKGEFVKIGEHTIHVPLLRDVLSFIASAEVKKDEKGQEIIEDGIPVYSTEEANWVQGAILSQVKMQARNKLVPGTATLKPDNKIPETWEELYAEGVRGPSAALALAREFKESFAEWVSKQGLSENASATLISLVSNKTALALQPQGNKEKVLARISKYMEDMDEETNLKFQRPIEALMEACQGESDPMDF